jgi:ribonuclease T2
MGTLICLLSESATARHSKANRYRDGSKKSPALFVLSWSPEYCADEGSLRNDTQCVGSRHYGLVAHGLWPEGHSACSNSANISQAEISSLDGIMPTKKLILHEWKEHGRCSGSEPEQFFGRIRALFRSLKIPERLKHPSTEAEVSAESLVAEFAGINPEWPSNTVALHCQGRYFREIRLCIGAADQPTPCTSTHSNCPSGTLLIRPVR